MDRSQLLNTLNRTFHLFEVSRFDIRVHWTIFVYLLILLSHYGRVSEFLGGNALVFALTGFFILFGVVLIHELGHAWAARRYGLTVGSIVLSPVGGQANLESNPRNPREEFVVTLCGPIVHPLLLTVGAVPYLLVEAGSIDLGVYGNEIVHQFFWINVFLLAFNLIPAFPMDGGRFLRAFLATRMPAAKATIIAAYIGQLASVIFIVVAVSYSENFRFLLFIIGIINLFACEQAKNMARHVDPYEGPEMGYGGTIFEGGYRDGQYSADAYLEEEKPKKRGPVRRYLDERAERRRQERARFEAEVRQKVDELLEKVSEVGLSGLDDEEREFLKKASELYKD